MINAGILINHGAAQRKYSKGKIIFFEGNKAAYFFLITEGKVKMINSHESGKEFIQGLFYAGQSFGELPLFTDENIYPATAIAETDITVMRLEKMRFLELLKTNFSLHFELTKTLAEKLRFKSLLNKEISGHTPEHLLLALFNYLKNNEKKSQGEFMVNLTRQELANLTGLRVETVIRAVKKLEKKGKVKLVKRKIYLD
ncbi:MAG: Crp/Fnr family transcriptional regulator [Parafilimonas sp.]